MLTTRRLFLLTAAALAAPRGAMAGAAWDAVLAEAKGQTVYFNAWAGSPVINDYIAWAGGEIQNRFGVTLQHVKITDTAEVVKRVRDEVAAGRKDGSADLVWINGENFRVMKAEGLLFGPFAPSLPGFAFVDTRNKPTVLVDFAEPTDGFESPWGMAQLTFFADGAKVSAPPMSMAALLDFAKANPGRVTYPAPPDFHGTTFVKQALAETVQDREVLGKPVTKDQFGELTGPLFAYLDQLHPHLWREGKQFPPTQAQVKQMLADGELLMALTFNPNEPANLVASGELPPTAIAWQNSGGTIGNTHFVAIPVNARSPAGAQVVAEFLLSPEAQARKADLKIWGDPTVLDLARLSDTERAAFPSSSAPGAVAAPAPVIPEPHGSFVPLIEATWLERYGA